MTPPSGASRAALGRLPGETGIWMLVAGDLMVFGLFFLTYRYYRALAPDEFRQSEATLNPALGLINTLLLLSGSLFVASAIDAHRRGGNRHAPRLIGAGILCGLGFVGVKAIEWGAKFAAGVTPMTNDFFMFYFMLTGIHLVHVLAGIAVLCFMLSLASRSDLEPSGVQMIEAGGIFWHLVDLLWIVLFALFYLIW